jgi:hypothetical protein
MLEIYYPKISKLLAKFLYTRETPMLKKIIALLPILFSLNSYADKGPNISKIRQLVGPVYAPPIEYQNALYFLGSSGALFTSNYSQTKVKELFKTKLRSVAEIELDGSIAFFGDGLHEDKKAQIYAYDLSKQKLIFKVPVPGHIEKKSTIWRNLLIVGLGPGGIVAIDKQNGKIVWKLDNILGKKLHVDSNPVIENDRIYVGSIYDYKAILCIQPKTGEVLWHTETEMSPKSDLLFTNNQILALTSNGDLATVEREVPSELLLINATDGKLKIKKTLRGSNYFPQLVLPNEVLMALSTGDIVSFDFKGGKISVVDQYPEPFLSSPFSWANKSCATSVMGRMFCYKDKKIVDKKELGEMVIGKVSSPIGGHIYLPTRSGYAIITQ